MSRRGRNKVTLWEHEDVVARLEREINDYMLAAEAEAQLADEFKAERDRLLTTVREQALAYAEALQYAADYPDLMNRIDELEAFVRDVAAPGRVYAEVRSERQQFDAIVAERRRLRDRAQALLDEEGKSDGVDGS